MKYSRIYYLIFICVLLSFILGKCVNNINHNNQAQVQPRPVEISKNPVEQIARKATVLITGVRSGSGSGVIIRSQDKYYVLTNKHVVGTPPGSQSQYEIKSYDGTVYLTITAKNYDQLVANTSGDMVA